MHKWIQMAAAVGVAGIMGAVGSAAAAELSHTIVHPGNLPSNVGAHTTFTGQVRHDSISRAD